MPTLTDLEIAQARDWVGDIITAEDLQEIFDRTDGDLELTVLAALRGRLADLLNEPASLSVDGLSINQAVNIQELRALIVEFQTKGLSGVSKGKTTVISRSWKR